ncbi:uncharacterized protein LOC113040221 isoform X2 [Carassius auratus]|uniref:Uncharacterized protein LOC113040221 isoform X2 n=1 Tax=Carassius auratus TaxID=7957 RepID=A0A6P6J4B5_CARAU|nr:uncharacterized protein LOC113040221 isoform X2 [Carassius auratus]
MKTVQLLLFCLLVCQTTESLTDKLVNLGENVTLVCQIHVTEIYWVFQKLTDSPRLILRTFSSDSTSSYIQDQRLKDKYSSLTKSRLFIINITIHELGIYYCVKPATTTLQFSNGTRLYINEAARDHNQTEMKNNSQNQNTQQPFIVLCFIPIIVMFLAIIGLFQIKLQVCKKYTNNIKMKNWSSFTAQMMKSFLKWSFVYFTRPTTLLFLFKRQNLDKYN